MVEGREKAAWWHTAHLIAAVVNVNRGKGARLAEPKEFHPHFAKQRQQQTRLTRAAFAGLWAACGGK